MDVKKFLLTKYSSHILKIDREFTLGNIPRMYVIIRTYPSVLHSLHDFIRGERYQTDTVCKEFITQHRRVGLKLHPVNGHRRGLCYEHSPQAVRHTESKHGHYYAYMALMSDSIGMSAFLVIRKMFCFGTKHRRNKNCESELKWGLWRAGI